jgi:hypothetical protein
VKGFEGQCSNDEIRERRSDVEYSEDDRRQYSKIGTLRKKAMNASSKFTHSLRKRGKRKIDYRVPIPSVSIEDVRDAREESAVLELRQRLVERGCLPPRHDDYHTLLRYTFSFFEIISPNGVLSLATSGKCYVLIIVALYFLVDFLKLGILILRRLFRCGKKCLCGEKNM